MTTKDLENKLKINENTGIHCPTLELAKQVLDIFHQLGLKWCEEKHYITCTSWDNYKEDTIYYPFEGKLSSLEFAHKTNYKIINAKEFIALHTKGEEFDLETYIPKGALKGFPKEIISRMLECQKEQGNLRDISIFEKLIDAGQCIKGFDWDDTQEDWDFWREVIRKKDFNLFFERYPKKDNQDNSQDFKVGDEVINIITGRRGKISQISTNVIYVNFNEKGYTLDGRCYIDDKHPRLLHYRDDYDYNVIDFNNLPKRQEPKRWRAEKGEIYYCFTSNFETEDYCEENDSFDDGSYDLGNYFKTKEEAQEVADKLKKCFKQVIQENYN